MVYQEFQPSIELAPVVRCYWHMRGRTIPGEASREQIVPDGCPEIIINFADPFHRILPDGRQEPQPSMMVVGQITSAMELVPGAHIDLWGIRLEPGGLFVLLGKPMFELTDVGVGVGQLRSRMQRRFESMNPEVDSPAMVAELDRVVQAFIEESALDHPEHRLVCQAIEGLGRVNGGIDPVLSSLGVNRRRLERAFRLRVGISPKLYARISRLQRVIHLCQSGQDWSFVQLALACGYYDQSHLIRDFGTIAHTTPGRYLAARDGLSHAFHGGVSHFSNS
jgi:AraC-like DNA-binding protein